MMETFQKHILWDGAQNFADLTRGWSREIMEVREAEVILCSMKAGEYVPTVSQVWKIMTASRTK